MRDVALVVASRRFLPRIVIHHPSPAPPPRILLSLPVLPPSTKCDVKRSHLPEQHYHRCDKQNLFKTKPRDGTHEMQFQRSSLASRRRTAFTNAARPPFSYYTHLVHDLDGERADAGSIYCRMH